MDENIIAFLIWCGIALILIVIGVASFFRKKPAGFWANVKQFEVTDVKKYNRCVGTLFIVYGISVILLGLPIISGIDGLIILSVLGMMFVTIATMAVYMIFITPKFEKK